jgi:hypothetical protein
MCLIGKRAGRHSASLGLAGVVHDLDDVILDERLIQAVREEALVLTPSEGRS